MAEALPEDKARTAAAKRVAWVFIMVVDVCEVCGRAPPRVCDGVCVLNFQAARQAEEPKNKNLTVIHSHETGNAHLFHTHSRIVDKDDE